MYPLFNHFFPFFFLKQQLIVILNNKYFYDLIGTSRSSFAYCCLATWVPLYLFCKKRYFMVPQQTSMPFSLFILFCVLIFTFLIFNFKIKSVQEQEVWTGMPVVVVHRWGELCAPEWYSQLFLDAEEQWVNKIIYFYKCFLHTHLSFAHHNISIIIPYYY
jgi:hypothetical protein